MDGYLIINSLVLRGIKAKVARDKKGPRIPYTEQAFILYFLGDLGP